MSERKGTRALELWCKRLVKDCPNIQIENMTTSWRNGMAFCALVHHFRPDLIDMSTLNPDNVYENNRLAFSIAEKHLGIPALLDPEDMVESEVPDRLSVLTYLSQFYQRLGHTVNTKTNDSDSVNSPSPKSASASSSIESNAALRFGKAALDKCVACGLPVYLAQRLIVSQKLYHRRCFRCSKCSGHLNPNNHVDTSETEFVCDNCKTEKKMSKFVNKNDTQMGMLAFSDSCDKRYDGDQARQTHTDTPKRRSQSILDKINMFEKNLERESIDGKLENLSLKESDSNIMSNSKDDNKLTNVACGIQENVINPLDVHEKGDLVLTVENTQPNADYEANVPNNTQENVYKSDMKKYSFLQTQLSEEKPEIEDVNNSGSTETALIPIKDEKIDKLDNSNITDDTRIANTENDIDVKNAESQIVESDIKINIPPRRKKRLSNEKKPVGENEKMDTKNAQAAKDYPDHLNPFSEDEEEEPSKESKRESTNPFGSSDDEEDEVTNTNNGSTDTPQKRVISVNPFWSDGEEPSSDEDESHNNSSMFSSMASSTPNLKQATPRRRKARAPPPPAVTVTVPPSAPAPAPATSMDDVASISSMSSYSSTVHSDQKSLGKLTPRLRKRVAPTPPDSISTISEGTRDVSCSAEKGDDTSGSWRRVKGPAPGLPLPERREVKLQLSPCELQVQLDMLETQQLGLERQGVLIEQMIRDKCEGDECAAAPQEEVEDLVIQLCELVNEKNDLFRKQTELMYIRRQQRLEQEQADIEHEIRVIQSRPAVNRIDADKAREEQLVSRLVEIVSTRDALVQQMEAERRRERQEDLAIAASIATRRAQRNSGSNSSSMKSDQQVVVTPKKNKVKDKMKKQFKKAKHSLIPKKKDDSEGKQDKPEKVKKCK